MINFIWKKRIDCKKNEDFISIRVFSGQRYFSTIDATQDEILLISEISNEELGKKILEQLFKSRELKDEDAEQLNLNTQKNYEVWVEKIKKLYGYKTKKAMFCKMHSCSVELKDGYLIFEPSHHEKLEAWGDGNGRITEKDYVIIPEKSSPEEIGAALRLAFSRCTGREF